MTFSFTRKSKTFWYHISRFKWVSYYYNTVQFPKNERKTSHTCYYTTQFNRFDSPRSYCVQLAPIIYHGKNTVNITQKIAVIPIVRWLLVWRFSGHSTSSSSCSALQNSFTSTSQRNFTLRNKIISSLRCFSKDMF